MANVYGMALSFTMLTIRAADRMGGGGNWGNLHWAPTLLGAQPQLHYQEIKYSNRTVILIQQSGKYSVDNYAGINC